MNREIRIRCLERCGYVTLTNLNYSQQLDNIDSGWVCPQCGGQADFIGIFFECSHCHKMVDEEESVCPYCSNPMHEEMLETVTEIPEALVQTEAIEFRTIQNAAPILDDVTIPAATIDGEWIPVELSPSGVPTLKIGDRIMFKDKEGEHTGTYIGWTRRLNNGTEMKVMLDKDYALRPTIPNTYGGYRRVDSRSVYIEKSS